MKAVIKRTRLVWSAALAALVLLGVSASGASAASPTITTPINGQQFKEHMGDPIEPVAIEGTDLNEVKATPELPEGLHLRPSAESPDTKWEIYGTPVKEEKEQPDDTTEITAKNEAGETSLGIVWTIGEPLPEFVEPFPGPQTSTVGTEIAPVIVKTQHAERVEVAGASPSLPEGLKFGGVPGHGGEWQITGTPKTPTPEPVTVELVAHSHEPENTQLSFKWTINPAPTTPETPSKSPETPTKPAETPAKPLETPPTTKTPSAGRLGTVPLQKPGKSLMASFLCEVSSCNAQLLGTITAGKSKFKLHSARTMIKQGEKMKIALKLSKKQQALIAAALKNHKKVTASLMATIQSSVGAQATKPLIVTVKR